MRRVRGYFHVRYRLHDDSHFLKALFRVGLVEMKHTNDVRLSGDLSSR